MGEGAAPERILVLTHNGDAAKRMREAIEGSLETAYEELHVETFHSFCDGLLRERGEFAAVTAADRLTMLLESIDEIPLRHHE